MKLLISRLLLFIAIITIFTSCATQRVSTLVGGEYNETKNETDYFVLPYGSVTLPGKWNKKDYNSISRQQFFTNQDSVIIAIAFGQYNNYEFNLDGSLTGYSFIKGYYEWDSKYFINILGLERESIQNDSVNNYIIYRIFGQKDKGKFDTYFLIGEKNGNISNFSISDNNKWTIDEKIEFLKNLFITKKNE